MEHHKNHDRVFFTTFSLVLGILGGIALVIAFIASVLTPDAEGLSKEQTAALSARIQPVGQAITDPAMLLKVAAKPARAPYTADETLSKVCNACHVAGVLGAPKEGDAAAWGTRLKAAGGLDGLVTSAIKGKNSMPPRGGDSELSDEEVKAAVEAMLKKSGA